MVALKEKLVASSEATQESGLLRASFVLEDAFKVADAIQGYPSLLLNWEKIFDLIPTPQEWRSDSELASQVLAIGFSEIENLVGDGDKFDQGWAAQVSLDRETDCLLFRSYNERLEFWIDFMSEKCHLSWTSPTLQHKGWVLNLQPQSVVSEILLVSIISASEKVPVPSCAKSEVRVSVSKVAFSYFESDRAWEEAHPKRGVRYDFAGIPYSRTDHDPIFAGGGSDYERKVLVRGKFTLKTEPFEETEEGCGGATLRGFWCDIEGGGRVSLDGELSQSQWDWETRESEGEGYVYREWTGEKEIPASFLGGWEEA